MGFVNFTKCDGQSIVGKWNCVSVKGYSVYNGKKIDLSKSSLKIEEFKSDNSFTETDTKTKYVSIGTYKVSGKQLIMNYDNKSSEKGKNDIGAMLTISSITETTLTLHYYTTGNASYSFDFQATFNKL